MRRRERLADALGACVPVDEVDNTTHAPPACNLSAPALCAPTMGYYGGD
eukprot:COSAG04_NODE_13512_length_602_cov_6.023857_2_plen_48_part_01